MSCRGAAYESFVGMFYGAGGVMNRHGMAIIVALSMMIVSLQAADRWWDGAGTGGTGNGASQERKP